MRRARTAPRIRSPPRVATSRAVPGRAGRPRVTTGRGRGAALAHPGRGLRDHQQTPAVGGDHLAEPSAWPPHPDSRINATSGPSACAASRAAVPLGPCPHRGRSVSPPSSPHLLEVQDVLLGTSTASRYPRPEGRVGRTRTTASSTSSQVGPGYPRHVPGGGAGNEERGFGAARWVGALARTRPSRYAKYADRDTARRTDGPFRRLADGPGRVPPDGQRGPSPHAAGRSLRGHAGQRTTLGSTRALLAHGQ